MAGYPDRPFAGASDTETLLRALGELGTDSLALQNGMFAFAALDGRSGRVVLARDRMGTKPLHWARRGDELWFASEVRALLEIGVARTPNRGALARAVSFGWAAGEEALISGVRRVSPGQVVEIELATSKVSSRTWHSLPADVDPSLASELAGRSRADLRRLLDGALGRAVEERLLAEVPVGVLCSGGIDSGVVTAMAARNAPDAAAFVAGMVPEGTVDESPAAEVVARAAGLELETVRIGPDDWRGEVVTAIDHYDQPLPTPTPVAISLVARAARERGVPVLLAGEGADEMFAGYTGRHRAALRELATAGDRARQLAAACADPGRLAQAAWARIRRRPPAPWAAPEIGAETSIEDAIHIESAAAYRAERPAAARVAGELLADLRLILPHLLNRMDANGMQHGVEVRLPFLSSEVVGLALNMPVAPRVLPQQKGVLREVAHQYLPARIARRPKVGGLMFDTGAWITDAARPDFLLRGMLADTLEIPATRWAATVEPVAGNPEVTLWSAEVWARLALGGQSIAAVEAEMWG